MWYRAKWHSENIKRVLILKKFTKNKVLTKLEKDKETLCVIMNKQEKVVDNKYMVLEKG